MCEFCGTGPDCPVCGRGEIDSCHPQFQVDRDGQEQWQEQGDGDSRQPVNPVSPTNRLVPDGTGRDEEVRDALLRRWASVVRGECSAN